MAGYGDVDLTTKAGKEAYGKAYAEQRNLAQRTPHFGVSRAEYLAAQPKKTISIPQWWRQATNDCPPTKSPVLIFNNKGEKMIAMSLMDWMGMIITIESEKAKGE